jgi:hypothetical protein
MQVQLSLIYLATVRVKMSGQAWPQGTAVSYALRLKDMLILPTPHWVSTNALLMNAATWGTLALELAIGILVWNRRLRPWVLAGGVVMHLLIMIAIGVGFFAPAMFVLYLAFLPPETVQQLPNNLKRVVRQTQTLLRRHLSATDHHHGSDERQEVDEQAPVAPPASAPSHAGERRPASTESPTPTTSRTSQLVGGTNV